MLRLIFFSRFLSLREKHPRRSTASEVMSPRNRMKTKKIRALMVILHLVLKLATLEFPLTSTLAFNIKKVQCSKNTE